MPYARKRKNRKRPYRRRRRYRKNYQVVRKSPMPLSFKTKLRYVEQLALNPGLAGTAAVNVFNAGGLYDPNTTGVGHQPRGFDQLMPLYDHYVVIGAKITATFATRASSLYPTMCGIALRDGSVVDTNPNDYLEGGSVVSGVISPDGTGKCIVTKSISYSPRRFLGRSKPMSDSQLKGSDSANPSEAGFFHVFCAPIQAVDEGPVDVLVRIDYIAVFIEPKDVAQS